MSTKANERATPPSRTCASLHEESKLLAVSTSSPGCFDDGSSHDRSCGAHGRCFIGKCICDQGYGGPRCSHRNETAMAVRATCYNDSSSDVSAFGSEEEEVGGGAVYAACRKHLQEMALIIRCRPRKGVMNQVTNRLEPCGDAVAWADVQHHWRSGSGVAQISNQRWRLAQIFEESTWNLLVRIAPPSCTPHLTPVDSFLLFLFFSFPFSRARGAQAMTGNSITLNDSTSIVLFVVLFHQKATISNFAA